MTTATDAGTELDVILLESLDFEPACTVGNEGPSVGNVPPCQAPATWAYRCRHCSHTTCYCDEHWAFIDDEVYRYSKHPVVRLFSHLPGTSPTGLVCTECHGHIMLPLPWQPIK